jgi:hypothetical protein
MDDRSSPGALGTASVPERSGWGAITSLVVLLVVTALSVRGLMTPENSVHRETLVVEETHEIAQPEVELEGVSSAATCMEREVRVARTGKFEGAKLRATPGFKYPQAGIVTRGAHLVVCETFETPGTKIPNVWYRIAEGDHTGLWLHKQVLDF